MVCSFQYIKSALGQGLLMKVEKIVRLLDMLMKIGLDLDLIDGLCTFIVYWVVEIWSLGKKINNCLVNWRIEYRAMVLATYGAYAFQTVASRTVVKKNSIVDIGLWHSSRIIFLLIHCFVNRPRCCVQLPSIVRKYCFNLIPWALLSQLANMCA